MSIGLILLVIVVVILIGGVGAPWVGRPDLYGYGYSHGGVGVVGIILIILVVLLLTGRL